MFAQFTKIEDFQKATKEAAEHAVSSMGVASKNVQALATETADYSKKAFEHGSSVLEKLVGAKSVEKAVEIQTAYVKDAYEGFVSYASKVGELYSAIAKDSVKPYETMFAKAAK